MYIYFKEANQSVAFSSLFVKEMRADLYAERKERAREVNERKAQKKASDATTKQLQLRSIIANAELAKCLFINERDRTQDHMDLPD